MPRRLFWSGLDAAQVAELERLANAGPSAHFHPTHGWTLAFHLVPAVLLVVIALALLRFELGRWSCGEGLPVASVGGVALALAFAALGWVGVVVFERLHGGAQNGWYVTDTALVHRQGPIVERYEWSSVVPLGWEWTETSTQVLRGKRVFSRPNDLTDRALVTTYAGQASRSSEWSFGVEGTDRQEAISDARGEAFDGFVAELRRRVRTAPPASPAEQSSVFWPAWPVWLAVLLIGGMVVSAASLSLAGNRWLEGLKLDEELREFRATVDSATPPTGSLCPADLERLTSSSELLLVTRHLLEKHPTAIPADRRAQLELAHHLASEAACSQKRTLLARSPESGTAGLRRELEARDAAHSTADTRAELELLRRDAVPEWARWWSARATLAWKRAADGEDVALLHLTLKTNSKVVTLTRSLDDPHAWQLSSADQRCDVDVQALAGLVITALAAPAGTSPKHDELEVGVAGFVTVITDERVEPFAAFASSCLR